MKTLVNLALAAIGFLWLAFGYLCILFLAITVLSASLAPDFDQSSYLQIAPCSSPNHIEHFPPPLPYSWLPWRHS